jgi:hypothetical protein
MLEAAQKMTQVVGDLARRLIHLASNLGEGHCRHTAAFKEKAQEDVLRANLGMFELLRFPVG